MYPHDAAKTERGARAAVIGAVAGIIPAIGLGCVRLLASEPPEVAAQLAGIIAFVLVYASPYLLALMASRARDPGVRGGLLAAIGLLSLVASFSDMSLVSIALLPATFVLWFAAARSLAASGRPLATFVPAAVGLLIVAPVALGFFALWGIQDDEARCWVLFFDSDGQLSHWESRPNVGGPGGLSGGLIEGGQGPAMVTYDGGKTWQKIGLPVGPRGGCISDIITNTEAAMGLGAVAAALLAMLLLLMRRRLLCWGFGVWLSFKQRRPPQGAAGATQHELTQAEETNPCELSRIRKTLGTSKEPMSSLEMLSTGGGIPVRQTKLAPDGLEFSEDVSEARWVEESLSLFRSAPLSLSLLAEVLALVGALMAAVPVDGGESIVEYDGWHIVPILLIPSILVSIGIVALLKWENQQSNGARLIAWLVSLVLLVGTLISMGVGPFFWPAAIVLLLATSVQQNSWWALLGTSIVLLTLLVFPPLPLGSGSYSWLYLSGVLSAMAIIGASRFRRKK